MRNIKHLLLIPIVLIRFLPCQVFQIYRIWMLLTTCTNSILSFYPASCVLSENFVLFVIIIFCPIFSITPWVSENVKSSKSFGYTLTKIFIMASLFVEVKKVLNFVLFSSNFVVVFELLDLRLYHKTTNPFLYNSFRSTVLEILSATPYCSKVFFCVK